MSRHETTVHIAGEMVDLLQKCSRCGEILTDYRNCSVASAGPEPPMLNGWTLGSFIGQRVGCSVLMDHDARELDETRCGASIQ